MKLEELLKSVKEEKLDKEQLEGYHTQLSNLLAEMNIEMAGLEKEEAIFMNSKHSDDTAIAQKIAWKATESGLRLIVKKVFNGNEIITKLIKKPTLYSLLT